MKICFRNAILAGIAALTVLSGCNKPGLDDTGFYDVKNPAEGTEISGYGETITVSFMADAAWDAELVTSDGGDWAEISSMRGNDAAGKGSVRIKIDETQDKEARAVEVYVTVQGYSRGLLCRLEQASALGSKLDLALNEQMNASLRSKYLWNEAYNQAFSEGKIDMGVRYKDFLSTNLMKLGDANLEDGGVYRDYSSLAGQRYVYSYIQEITAAKSKAPATRASSASGLGMGPTLAMAYNDQGVRCLSLGYVYPGSPAAEAGLRRGDMIIAVNGNTLNAQNYSRYQQELYYATSGSYNIKYARFQEDGETLLEDNCKVTAALYQYDPVLWCTIHSNDEGKTSRVAYMVLESFDISSQDILENYLDQLKELAITDLILDLRYNPGGSVAQCRYLLSSIAGPAHYKDVFAKLTFNDGRVETQTFGDGDASQPDGLGQGPDLGLERLFVITSENTGSAAEIVINALRGIDFPVTTYGSRSEGKNVGMVTERLSYNGRQFEFAPIMFYVQNAKGFGDYADGFEPDHSVNNQDADWNNDIDRIFPYGATEWGNLEADPAFMWVLMNIYDGKDPDWDTVSSAAIQTKAGAASGRFVPVRGDVPVAPAFGRYGSLIYGGE